KPSKSPNPLKPPSNKSPKIMAPNDASKVRYSRRKKITRMIGTNAIYEIEKSTGPISNAGNNSVNKFARPLSDIAKIKIITFCDCVYAVFFSKLSDANCYLLLFLNYLDRSSESLISCLLKVKQM